MSESSILIRNIFHMLCYAFRVLRQRNYADIETEDFLHVQDMLAAILARGIAQQLKQGLYRSYVSYNDQLRSLRGKLDPLETSCLRAQKIQRAACSFDELSEDNELNQILRMTALALLYSNEVSRERKNELKRVVSFFSGVSDISLAAVQWSRLQIHRNNRSYEMLMSICQMAWKSLLPSTARGNTRFSLFDEESLPKLYEKFLLEYYRQHYPMLQASDCAIEWDLSEDTDPEAIRMLPGMHSDVMLRHDGKTLIIDAKFYQNALANYMGKQMLHSANLYQIFTYVRNEDRQRTGNVSGMLLYARTTEETPPFLDAIIGGNRIRVSAVDLNGSFQRIAGTLDCIVSETFLGACKKKA